MSTGAPMANYAAAKRAGDFVAFNRVRGLFYPAEPPASTVVEVSRFLPGDSVVVEVEATLYLPR